MPFLIVGSLRHDEKIFIVVNVDEILHARKINFDFRFNSKINIFLEYFKYDPTIKPEF